MAAARADNGANGKQQHPEQRNTMIQPRPTKGAPHPTPPPPARYPTILVNARKPAPVATARRLAPAQPRCPLKPPVPVVTTSTATTTTTTSSTSGGSSTVPPAVLISADSIRRTVYAASYQPTGSTNGLTKPAAASPLYKLVAGGGSSSPRKRMPQLAPKPAAPDKQYNNAPGWRRILRNKVIVYVSPSNIVLHSYEQAKEYLLKAGTCKCGLPCPFNPERFFQFDAQIPNVTMAPKAQPANCAHAKRAISSDVRPERTKRLHTEATGPSTPPQQARPAAQSAILLKTPPWRKNVPTAERTASPEQKKPTFKDDPTGYLNQQTAILHSSISFLHSPDRRSPVAPGSPVAPEPAPARRPLPPAKPTVVKYEPKPVAVPVKPPAPARISYYVKANAGPGEQQGTAAKVAKLNLAAPVTTLTTTTTTTIARTHPISTPLVPTSRATPHIISTVGGAQIVVIDGLQHGSGGAGGGAGPRIGGFQALRPPQTLPKPSAPPTVVSYSLGARPPNGTMVTTNANTTPTSSSAMILNGTNIIQLGNGLGTPTSFGALLPDASPAPKPSLALPTNGTLVLNPGGTSIRFAPDGSAGSFVKPNVSTNTTTTTYHYAPITDGLSGPRKLKRLPPQPATFHHQQPQQQPGPFVQIATPYGGLQNIQLAPGAGLSGLTVVPVSKAQPQPQPQHAAPYNLLSPAGTILLPAGSMVMTSDAVPASTTTTTLLQLQNPLLTGQPPATATAGLVLRQPKPAAPQPASFLATQTPYLIHGAPRIGGPPAPHQRTAQPGGTIFAMQPAAAPATNPAAEPVSGLESVTGKRVEKPAVVQEAGKATQPPPSPKVATGPDKDGGSLCPSVGSETESSSGAVTITLKSPVLHAVKQQQQQQPSQPAKPPAVPPSEPNRTGRIVSAKVGMGRPASANMAVRRTAGVPVVQAATNNNNNNHRQLPGPGERVKLTPHHHPAPVLPEQSYDGIISGGGGGGGPKSRGAILPEGHHHEPGATCPVFGVGDLVWGAVRGFPAWPGKVLRDGDAVAALEAGEQKQQPEPEPQQKQYQFEQNYKDDHKEEPAPRNSVWVRWFGTGRTHAERVDVATLRSLSEGLEMHHRAQKDARKSRKLNAQLEQAIQQAMQELDRAGSAGTTGSGGFGRHGGTTSTGAIGQRRNGGRYRRRRHLRRQPPPGKHLVVRPVTGSSNSSTTATTGSNRRSTGNVRYLRGNKFKAKS